MSRVTAFDQDIAVRICTRIAEGEGLVQICKDADFPAVSTVYRWIASNPEFQRLYELAREDQADTLGDQILEISDEAPIVVKRDDNGEEVEVVLDAAAIQRQRLRVDARKFVAAKLKPKRWGDRVEHVGAGGAPLIPDDPLSKLEAARRIAFVLAQAEHIARDPALLPPPDGHHGESTPAPRLGVTRLRGGTTDKPYGTLVFPTDHG